MLSHTLVQSLKDPHLITGFHKHSHHQVHHKYSFLAAIAAIMVCSTLKNHFRFCSMIVYDSSISPSDSRHPSGNPAIDVQDSSKPRRSALQWLILSFSMKTWHVWDWAGAKLSLLIRLLANYIHHLREALITVFFSLMTHPSLKVGVLIIKIKFLLTHLGSPCSTSLITDMQVCVLVWSYIKAFAMVLKFRLWSDQQAEIMK